MTAAFEEKKNRKAFFYTVIVCGVILLLSLMISWTIVPPTKPIVQDLIEINLGNEEDGFGDVQPLIKGEMGQAATELAAAAPAAKQQEQAPIEAIEDNTKEDAPVSLPKANLPAPKVSPSVKPVSSTPTLRPAPVSNAPVAPKPQRAKIVYNGSGNGGGNNSDEDNGFRTQGNKPGGQGDAGSPSGNKDSYGTTPGGRTGGGPRVISGTRKVINYYSYRGDLPKATIYAQINVSPQGKGSFVKLVKPSTSFSRQYAQAITSYLKTIEFDKSTVSSAVVVRFNFEVN